MFKWYFKNCFLSIKKIKVRFGNAISNICGVDFYETTLNGSEVFAFRQTT